MPELPEVETVLRTLEKRIKDKQIKDVEVLWNNIIVGDVQEFKHKLIGQHFRSFKRRGKYLIFELDDVALLSHLRMEGKYYLQTRDEPITKHIHVIFDLGDIQLRYHDTRKFGKMEIIAKDQQYNNLKNLGVEPLSDDLNFDYVKDFLKNKKKTIKELLLDQTFIAGIGNIYADEILFLMGVDPSRIANSLTDEQMQKLVESTKEVLALAIAMGGTTIRSYTSSLKVTGLFQQKLNVHTKVNEPCPKCGTIIKKTKVGQRGTYYCEKCQK